MNRIIIAAVTGLLLVMASLIAQENEESIRVTGGRVYEDRASTRLLYRNRATDKPLGQVAVSYGRPQWKAEYNDSATFDELTNGRVWRFGKDFWTVLDTSLPLRVAGKPVASGDYYLGLHRSKDGSKWSLAFIDAHEARKMGLDSARIGEAPLMFKVPATHEKPGEVAEQLTITLSQQDNQLTGAVLTILWGAHKLSVPIQVELDQ